MNNSTRQQELDSQKPNGFSVGLQIFDSIESWLARLFELSDEELEAAGVYFYDERYE